MQPIKINLLKKKRKERKKQRTKAKTNTLPPHTHKIMSGAILMMIKENLPSF